MSQASNSKLRKLQLKIKKFITNILAALILKKLFPMEKIKTKSTLQDLKH